MRRSRQSEVILEELRKVTSHPRADEIYTMVRQRLPKISLGTVYRNMDRLRREDMALEIYCGDFIRYDGNTSPHDHFMCRSCRRVWDFDQGQTGPENDFPVNQFGYQIEGRYTVFHGLCPDCQKSTEN